MSVDQTHEMKKKERVRLKLIPSRIESFFCSFLFVMLNNLKPSPSHKVRMSDVKDREYRVSGFNKAEKLALVENKQISRSID